ncbi:MAG: hypothetical protein AAGB48_01855 [Planctomycetota bacterium]
MHQPRPESERVGHAEPPDAGPLDNPGGIGVAVERALAGGDAVDDGDALAGQDGEPLAVGVLAAEAHGLAFALGVRKTYHFF